MTTDATPITDAALDTVAAERPFKPVPVSFLKITRQLERELSAANEKLAAYPRASGELPEADHSELVKHLREEAFDCPLCAQAADYLDLLRTAAAARIAELEAERGEREGWVRMPVSLLSKMADDHIISGGPGPLYAAGWAAACQHWAMKLLAERAALGKK